MPTSMMASLTKSSVPHTGQRYGYSRGGGPKGSSRSSLACGTSSCRRISSPTHRLELVIHHTVLRMPHLPHVHLMVAMRTAQRVATGTLMVAFPITITNAKPPAMLEESRCFTYAEDLPECFDRSKPYQGDLPC